ncbi:hypothetical protein JAAARDRAFT_27871 [Jaapia argillacea MUCL 33604]|uniref:DH domain-containing protein n=1 Tax=Jaapia argillacea MUCL 33604 TaxID=933084 RepID=A0A067QDJ4_9AGAM|nr:hypothetical protein JAAARDRAFT_27871 [Jaapia argillacea MUCL 33604]
MTMNASPRKIASVPLSGGADWQPTQRPNLTGPTQTKRVFFCGVVVENAGGGELSQDVQELVASLGDPIPMGPGSDTSSSSSDSPLTETNSGPHARKRAMTDTSALSDVINELVSTERSYVKRLRILKHDYADPLRTFAKSKDTAILPAYEANTLFGNIDTLLPINEAFLVDLEKMMTPEGRQEVGGVGDVALKHFKYSRHFEDYKHYYVKREEAQAIFEREMAKRSSNFVKFVDRVKYSSADMKNRVGLRELLMDPVQRVPRYTLLFRTMIKFMAASEPQRAKLIEADEIASKIAQAETDEHTKRATTMYCLGASVDGFPPGLISNSRRFIDCIDVEDVITMDPQASSTGPGGGGTATSTSLHCTLFLFDDKLLFAKRPNGEKGGRALAGLDDLEKVTRGGGPPKKRGMSCKGVVDITEVVVTDVGGPTIHMFLENPPQDQSDRWSSRPFRSLSVVIPPAPVDLNPTQTEAEKRRFLENLWSVQAKYRARAGQSVVLSSEDREVESRGGKTTIARTYFNIYQRTAFLKEIMKTKVVLHIDELGSADPIPLGMNGPPYVVVRVHPMPGEVSRYTVTSSDPTDEGEVDIVQTSRVSARIVHTIHQYGLFKFRTGNNSRPSTPTGSLRSRAAILGLDAISRNLFNARPGSSKGDIFGGSISSHRRSKSSVSRSSTITQSNSTGDNSLMRFSHRSNSTAATTISTMDDDDSFGTNKSLPRSKKLTKRGRSPGGSESEKEGMSSKGSRGSSRSRSKTRELDMAYSAGEEEQSGGVTFPPRNMDQSEWDLALRLNLARQNSQNQDHPLPPPPLDARFVEDAIYEEEPPRSLRPSSRASRVSNRDTCSQRSTTPRAESPSPRTLSPPRHSRSVSQHSAERRPIGPRIPSPPSSLRPIPRSPRMDVLSLATPIRSEVRSPIPSNRRTPFDPPDATPKPLVNAVPQTPIEPLSIKKKTSVRSPIGGSPSSVRRNRSRMSPLNKSSSTKPASPRRFSPRHRPSTKSSPRATTGVTQDNGDSLVRLEEATREELGLAHRAIKRMKAEVESHQASIANEDDPRPGTPLGKTSAAVTKEAQARMEEMRQLIGRRGEGPSRIRPRSIVDSSSVSNSSSSKEFTRTIEEFVSNADKHLTRAMSNQELQCDGFKLVIANLGQVSTELDKAKGELQSTRRQCELMKSLLADATAEKEIMYEAFNEELDGMFNDVNLPEDDAWEAMTTDLRQTKEARNALARENSQLKRHLAEMEMQKEEWANLLREHGLIS